MKNEDEKMILKDLYEIPIPLGLFPEEIREYLKGHDIASIVLMSASFLNYCSYTTKTIKYGYNDKNWEKDSNIIMLGTALSARHKDAFFKVYEMYLNAFLAIVNKDFSSLKSIYKTLKEEEDLMPAYKIRLPDNLILSISKSFSTEALNRIQMEISHILHFITFLKEVSGKEPSYMYSRYRDAILERQPDLIGLIIGVLDNIKLIDKLRTAIVSSTEAGTLFDGVSDKNNISKLKSSMLEGFTTDNKTQKRSSGENDRVHLEATNASFCILIQHSNMRRFLDLDTDEGLIERFFLFDTDATPYESIVCEKYGYNRGVKVYKNDFERLGDASPFIQNVILCGDTLIYEPKTIDYMRQFSLYIKLLLAENLGSDSPNFNAAFKRAQEKFMQLVLIYGVGRGDKALEEEETFVCAGVLSLFFLFHYINFRKRKTNIEEVSSEMEHACERIMVALDSGEKTLRDIKYLTSGKKRQTYVECLDLLVKQGAVSCEEKNGVATYTKTGLIKKTMDVNESSTIIISKSKDSYILKLLKILLKKEDFNMTSKLIVDLKAMIEPPPSTAQQTTTQFVNDLEDYSDLLEEEKTKPKSNNNEIT